jgi:hypothetical protein
LTSSWSSYVELPGAADVTSCLHPGHRGDLLETPLDATKPPSPFPSLSGSLSLSPVRDLTDTEHAAMAVVFRRR